MTSECLEPDNEKQDSSQPGEQDKESADEKVNAIGKSKASDKKKHFNVLHEDGSFADLPYSNQPGGGALEGSVGIGT